MNWILFGAITVALVTAIAFMIASVLATPEKVYVYDEIIEGIIVTGVATYD